MGYETKIINSRVHVKRVCEYCGKEFYIEQRRREVSFCSQKCSTTYRNKDKENIKKVTSKYKKYVEERQNEIRMKQVSIYNDLKFKLGREPMKKEWVEECKKNGVSAEISRSSSPFRSWKILKEFASTVNHKVVSVEFDGYEDVYNITVDDNHNYGIVLQDQKTFIYSKNCGEAVLGNAGACNLGSLVLPNFITGNVNTNWKKLERAIKLAVRFLDNVLDINKYALSMVEEKAKNTRRIGIGVMGLAEYLFAKGLRYGSMKAALEVERLMRFIRDVAYLASIELAVEKGAFPKFDPTAYSKASFVTKLPAAIRKEIKKNGIRNVTLMAFAPTGTISLLADVTSSIEPLFSKAYKRVDRVSERVYIHPFFKQCILEGKKVPDWFVDTFDLKPQDHFEMQSLVQRYVDGAVSKCISLDTLILTDKGWIKLGDISGNREEDTFTPVENLSVITEQGVQPVKSFYYNGRVDGIQIKTKFGYTLSGTKRHRIRVVRDESVVWAQLGDIKENDVVIIIEDYLSLSFDQVKEKIQNGQVSVDVVTEVKDIYVETADLEIESIHNYIANGFISHNTINMPSGTTPDQLTEWLLEYAYDLKGVTVYVDGSRENVPLNRMNEEEAREYLRSEMRYDTSNDENDVACAKGTCEI